MRSTEQPMIWVHATISDRQYLTAVAMRDGEMLEDAIGRGVCHLLDEQGATWATEVWSETMDAINVELESPLMDGRIPGAIVHRTGGIRSAG